MSTGRSILRGAVMTTAMRISVAAITFGFFALAARHWGAQHLGEFSTAFALFLMLQQVPLLGLHFVLIRDVVQAPDAARNLVSSVLMLGLMSSVALAVLVAAAAYVIYPRSLFIALLLVAVALLPSVVTSTGEALLIARERFETVALIAVSESVIRTILWIGIIVSGFGVVALLTALLICRVIAAWVYWRHERGLAREFSVRAATRFEMRRLVVMSPPFFGILLLTVCVSRLDFLMLSAIAGPVALGLYSAPYRIAEGFLMISQAVTVALFPRIAKDCAVNTDNEKSENFSLLEPQFKLVATAIRGLTILGFAGAIGLATIAPLLVPLLFGPSFAPAFVVLVILAGLPVPVAIDQVLGSLLLANHRQRADLVVMAVCGSIYLVALAILVPLYGYVGAAAATLLTALVQLSVRIIAVRITVRVRGLRRLVLRPTLAALAAGAVACVVPWPVVSMLASLTTYAALLVGLRAVQPFEIRAIIDSAAARLPRRIKISVSPVTEAK